MIFKFMQHISENYINGICVHQALCTLLLCASLHVGDQDGQFPVSYSEV